ncbi:hypothetical protein ACGFI9_33170 [Micromonospora sp. NPDC048930]|uniref:hypothetical protein n=1 Tax=Micromonospora sp. NPDC048930 TaxID=3364261 RepID=UPI00371D02CC
MRAYQERARPARLLAALSAGAAVAAALTSRRRGPWSRAVAATVAGALVGRRLANALAGPTGGGAGPARPAQPRQDGPDELRLWVAAGDLAVRVRPDPATDPLSS